MDKLKVVKVDSESIEFDNGASLSSYHDQDCCENHYLSFEHLSIEDFEGLHFDISKDDFFNKIEGYGIELLPISGHPVRIPGYGSNNGYYSTDLQLVVKGPGVDKTFDISECQEISY